MCILSLPAFAPATPALVIVFLTSPFFSPLEESLRLSEIQLFSVPDLVFNERSNC